MMLFKIASEAWEFEAIHRLNYRTFVEELPQHPANADKRLVDRFHAENTYAICIDGERLAGMICGRGKRPFSLDGKLVDLDAHLPAGRKVFEVRLLAVEPQHRNRTVFARLAALLAHRFRDDGFDLAVISGTTRQFKLYEHLGFIPFGPLVGQEGAQFQPMYLTLESFADNGKALMRPTARAQSSFLCGPVDTHDEVRKAFSRPPLSHRSQGFLVDFTATRRTLCELTGARDVQVLLGSGTLANDAVAAQIAASGERGLVLSNGEFGERLVDHASRHGLQFEVMRLPWGSPFDPTQVAGRIQATGSRWLWAVHCETSTGVLNDVNTLKTIGTSRGVKLCLDCISSIGASPVDLAGVHLATCVSGKALSSFPGLSMVFHEGDLISSPAMPRYLDLGYYARQSGVPFTGSSNLVHALQAALVHSRWEERFRITAEAGAWLRRELRASGFTIVASEACAAPAVTTIALPSGLSSRLVGARLKQAGFLLSYQSAYLLDRNWLQIALMGEWSEAALLQMMNALKALARHGQTARHRNYLARDERRLVGG
jgi:aspartate aminotransferase-like enzyme